MLRNVLLASLAIAFVAALHHLEPIHKSTNYVIYPLKDYPDIKTRNIQQRQETRFGNVRTVVELPANDTAPEDDGSNFGDLTFDTTEKDGDLLIRETLINNFYEEDIVVVYNQTFPEASAVKDFKILNFGRERGYAYRAAIYHTDLLVEVELIIQAEYEVRILLETYGTWD